MSEARYFTGIPCKNGHLSERYTASRNCIECHKLGIKRYRAKFPERHAKNVRKYKSSPRGRISGLASERRRRGIPQATRPMPSACENCLEQSNHTLQIDHCHETGKFRGWLCIRCNTGLGKLGDNLAGIRQALVYLERSNV